MTRTITYTDFAAQYPDATFSVFDAGLVDFDSADGEEAFPALDVLVYATEEDADLDENEGKNGRTIARATVIDNRDDASLNYSACAKSWALWNEFVNVDAVMTREEFDDLTVDQKIALQVEAFGKEEQA